MHQPGQAAADLLPAIAENALNRLPIPKRMRWGSRSEEVVRPVHWELMLFGTQVVPGKVMGHQAVGETRGHRFLHPAPIKLSSPADYEGLLEETGRVIADYERRKSIIQAQVEETAQASGATAVIDPELLDEVTSLAEWPVPILGSFEERFLEIPAECLVQAMQSHQKYFPVVDAEGRLLPHFITISNIDSRDPEQVRSGNERVIRPRLADAAFFWNQDRKQPLEQRADGLRNRVFEKRLGTLFDKQQRVASLAASIATAIGSEAAHAQRAAQLCKCDLLTSMVFEFPDLQGVMGRYYALHDAEPHAVADAIREHYLPRFAGDELPATPTGQALALADRLDSLVGIFAIGQQPSGDKDPFALRRAALGLIRICIERQLDLDIEQLLNSAAQTFEAKVNAAAAVQAVFDYVMDRLRGYYQEAGVEADLVEAVLATRPSRPLDFDRRVQACRVFRDLPEAQSLAAANKRISNILKKWDQPIPAAVDRQRLIDAAEQQLAERLADASTAVLPLMQSGDYTPALKQLATLKQPVDAFFDSVMVMDEDSALRDNRLALLQSLRNLLLRVADLSRLQS